MAKKATKKQIKKTVKATKSVSSKLNTSSVKEEVKSSVKKVKGNAGAAIEKLSNEGNAQASHIWKHIKNKDMSEGEIKSLINSKNFFALLGKLS